MPRGTEGLHGHTRLPYHRWITGASLMASADHPRAQLGTLRTAARCMCGMHLSCNGSRDGTFTVCPDGSRSQCQLATVPTGSTPAHATLHTVTCMTRWLRLSLQRRPLETTLRQPVLTHCVDGSRDGTFTACPDVSRSQCQLATVPTGSTPAHATLHTVTCMTRWLRLSSWRRPLETRAYGPWWPWAAREAASRV
jgi:hypothetical protein